MCQPLSVKTSVQHIEQRGCSVGVSSSSTGQNVSEHPSLCVFRIGFGFTRNKKADSSAQGDWVSIEKGSNAS